MGKMLFVFTGLMAAVTVGRWATPAAAPGVITATNTVARDTVKIIMEKTTIADMSIVYITDTAETTAGIKDVMNKDYGELMQFIEQNNLQPRRFMAWYHSIQPPWPVDIAVETDKLPSEVKGRIRARVQQGGEVIIAHMWGPYDQLGQAYGRIQAWLNENGRKAGGPPFEVYVNDPLSVKSASAIQTDVYQPIK